MENVNFNNIRLKLENEWFRVYGKRAIKYERRS